MHLVVDLSQSSLVLRLDLVSASHRSLRSAQTLLDLAALLHDLPGGRARAGAVFVMVVEDLVARSQQLPQVVDVFHHAGL